MPQPKFQDLTGRIFGKLTVLGKVRQRGKRATYWRARCRCGAETLVRRDKLVLGKTETCGRPGCRRPSGGPHGDGRTKHPEHVNWTQMLARCGDPERPHYGADGVTVCERWRQSFWDFLADMGVKPGPEYSLDRWPNPTGNYEPGNCRWATRTEQNRNQRRNLWVDFLGERLLLVELCERLGLNRSVVAGRLQMGWELEEALTIPVRTKAKGFPAAKS